MELHKNTANAFINYLKLHGYPVDRIVTEYKIGKYAVDIAVLDEDINLPVAIYEVKGQKTENSINFVIKQLNRYIRELGYSVQAGAIFSKETAPHFEYINLSSEVLKREHQSFNDVYSEYYMEPISWDNLKYSAKPKVEKKIAEEKRKNIDKFSIISWVLALITSIFLVLENFKLIVFSTERLIVYGAILLLIILPFFSEIKFGETFLKRSGNEQKKSKNK